LSALSAEARASEGRSETRHAINAIDRCQPP
jgi:hypothetical protein